MTLCIIQSRLGSTRLPGKALADICGKPLIQHVVDRVRQVRGIDQIVVAVPVGDIPSYPNLGVPVVGVPKLKDAEVLGRYYGVAQRYPDADTIVRVTGDCPLLSVKIAEQVLALYAAESPRGCEYASNVAPGYGDGTDTEVFSAAALTWAHREAKDAYDREHVTPWIRRHVKTATLLPETPTTLKTSVDTEEDLARVRDIVGRVGVTV